MRREVRNVAASVHARLLARSRERGEDFQFVLQRYAAERFLYRLSQSTYRDRYVLKGAMLYTVWGGSVYRPTRDLDFTGYGSSDTETVLASLREICVLPVEDDGMVFQASALSAEPIRDDAEYDGLRVRFQATLGAARIPMQIDVGFGNAIQPPAGDVEYPTLLDAPVPRVRAYPHEAVIAEKFHAMVLYGERTSRLKDFYDLYVIAKEFPLDGERLAGAIAATFERRRTAIEAAPPAALTPRFFADGARAAQWRAYLDRNRLPGAPKDFDAVGELLRAFLGPPWDALAAKAAFASGWKPGGPWETTGVPSAATSLRRAYRVDLVPPAARSGSEVVRAATERPADAKPRRFKRYPAYKDSGVEWLGEIPAHWEVRRLKHFASLNPESLREDTDPSFEMVYVDIGGVDSLGRMVEKERHTFGSAPSRARRVVKGGDVIVSTVRTYLRAIAAIADPEPNLVVSTGFAVVRPREALVTEYAAYALRAPYFVDRVVANSKGVSFPAINESEMATYGLAVPPSQEQRAIGAFLDRETAKIDALVAKKEQLTELLQEKRTALITRAVTKGLDPNVAMKNSGVEWLGEIPAHWEVKKWRYCCQVTEGQVAPDDERYRNRVMIAPNHIESGTGRILFTETADEQGVISGKYLVRPGDIIYSKIRPALNKACIASGDWLCSADMYPVRITAHDLTPHFLLYFILSEPFVRLMVDESMRVAMPKVNREKLAACPLLIPPRAEQEAIVAFLDRETARIDAPVAKVRHAIERLKELRTAFISAAVTGKIDVREAVAA